MLTLNISEGSNTIFVVSVHLIYLYGYLFASLHDFLQKLFDILIQIFNNLQSFQWSWIAMIAVFVKPQCSCSVLILCTLSRPERSETVLCYEDNQHNWSGVKINNLIWYSFFWRILKILHVSMLLRLWDYEFMSNTQSWLIYNVYHQ